MSTEITNLDAFRVEPVLVSIGENTYSVGGATVGTLVDDISKLNEIDNPGEQFRTMSKIICSCSDIPADVISTLEVNQLIALINIIQDRKASVSEGNG